MEKLKLLFLTYDQSNQIDKSSYYLGEELRKQCDLVIWNHGGRITDILSHCPYKPDFILLNDCFAPKLCPPVEGLNEIEIPKGVIFHDISNYIQQRKRFVVSEHMDAIFVHYKDAFKKWYPKLNQLMFWLPHHINTDIIKDYHLKKTIDTLMMGSMSPRLYPLRVKMLASLKNRHGFVDYPHPGYGHEEDIQPGTLIGEAYAKEINRAKIFLTCNSIYEYPLMKYFEILGCNTLLLAPSSKELTELGFLDGQTFVRVNQHNFKEKVAYYLEHEEERNQIARCGYLMVRSKHSTKQRAAELIKHIQQIIQKKTNI
jgi:hypothetical protein